MLYEPPEELLPLLLLSPQVLSHALLRSEGPRRSLVSSRILSLALPVPQLVDDVRPQLRLTTHVVHRLLDVDAEVVLGVEGLLAVV